MASGFVLIHRSVLQHWTWRSREPFTYRCAWLDLVIGANWQTGTLEASQRYLATRWRWDRSKVRRFLERLEADCMIQTATGPYSIKDRQGQPSDPWKPTHLPTQETTHLIIFNYFAFQEARPTKRPTDRPKYKERVISPLSKDKELSDKTETHPQAIKLAHLLKQQILSENGKRKTPTTKQLTTGHHSWARILRLMIEREKRDPQEISRTIQWLYTINPSLEASFVVLSAQSLRTKYDAIQARMKRTGHASKPPPKPPRSPPSSTTTKDTQPPKKRPPKPPWLR